MAIWLITLAGSRLNETQIERLNTAHAQYVQQMADVKANHLPILMEVSSALYAGDSIQGWTTANLQRSRDAHGAVKTAQRTVEATFFNELGSIAARIADDAGMQRVRLARERQWLNHEPYSSNDYPAGGRRDGMIDLERLLRRIQGLDLSDPAIDRILADYELAVAPLLAARQRTLDTCTDLDNELRVEWQAKRVETGEKYPDMRARHEERGLTKARAAARVSGDPIAELNRVTMEKLLVALPPASAERVRRTFDRMSWPHIHDDRSSAAGLLTAALKLSDLTAQQRTDIENIAAEYRPTYDALLERMKTMAEGPDSSIYDQEHSTEEQRLAFMHRRTQRQRMLFDRHELNVRAWQRLKAVLTEDQAKAIGMTATPPEGPGENDDFGT